MKTFIAAIGTAVPKYKRDQKSAAEIVAHALQLGQKEKRVLKFIYNSTGIDYRYSVMSDFTKEANEYSFFPKDSSLPFPSTGKRMQLYQREALPLALDAISNCLKNIENFSIGKITHVITVSCTGMYAPGLDIEIVESLNLSPHVKRTCINFMGCYGAFNALKVADSICKTDPQASVLIVCLELCTIHFQKNDSMDSIFSNAIFADGAAAVLLTSDILQEYGFCLEGFHCDLLTQNRKEMAWTISDNGFDIVLSSYVPQAIEAGIPGFLERMASVASIKREDVDLFAIHPGGVKILNACEKALSINKEDNQFSYDVLRQYGNMSSATVLFVLKSIWEQSRQYLNKRIFSCAFGPGLTLEALFLKIIPKPS